jgi:hypothetical protein
MTKYAGLPMDLADASLVLAQFGVGLAGSLDVCHAAFSTGCEFFMVIVGLCVAGGTGRLVSDKSAACSAIASFAW